MLVSFRPCHFWSATQFEAIFVGINDIRLNSGFVHLVDAVVIQARRWFHDSKAKYMPYRRADGDPDLEEIRQLASA
jgi:hypothetical protein